MFNRDEKRALRGQSRTLALAMDLLIAMPLIWGGRHVSASALPPGVPQEWYDAVTAQLISSEYYFSPSSSGEGYAADNVPQRLAILLTANDAEIAATDENGTTHAVRVWFAEFGRENALSPISPGSVVNTFARMENARISATEWFVNFPDGLEHGFTIPSPPAGKGRIAIRIGIESSLAVVPDSHTSGVSLRDGVGSSVLRYGNTVAWDASGVVLVSDLEVVAGGVEIHVDDTNASYPITVDPIFTQVASINFQAANGRFGFSVTTAGDIGSPPDGRSDVLVGAPGVDTDGDGIANDGRVYLFLGTATGVAVQPHWRASINQAGDKDGAWFGYSVAGAGDFNNDGQFDVAVGAPLATQTSGQAEEGAVLVFYGPLDPIAGSAPDAAPNVTFEGNQAGAHLGASLAYAGDAESDAGDEIIVGAPDYDSVTGGVNSGVARLFCGSPSNSTCWFDEGAAAGDRFGFSVGGAGVFRGDFSRGGVLVGAPGCDSGGLQNSGCAHAYYSNSSGSVSESPDWVMNGGQAEAGFGWSITRIGDLQGDGNADIAVGAPFYDNGQTNEGMVFVWYGSSTGFKGDGGTALVDANVSIEMNQAGAMFGESVATAGDVNLDFAADLLVGARFYDYNTAPAQYFEGKVFLFKGKRKCKNVPGGINSVPAESLDAGLQSSEMTNFGRSIGTAGDVNDDGASDIVIGADRLNHPGTHVIDSGQVRVWTGSTTLPIVTPTQTLVESGGYGSAVIWAGDLNGDGRRDLAVGAPGYVVNGNEIRGRVLAYYGTEDGTPPSPSWTWSCTVSGVCDQQDTSFGSALAFGDFNSDGYDDLAVGAEGYNSGAGRAFVFYGSNCGLHGTGCQSAFATPWTADGSTGGKFGRSVGSAGDTNGDGCRDLVIGAWQDSTGGAAYGRAFLFLGCSGGGGLAASQDWIGTSVFAGGGYGWSVGSAGDVNGDGYGDVFVSEPNFANGQSEEGRVQVYHGRGPGNTPSLPAAASWTKESDSIGAHFGFSAATAGDVNRDGWSDLLIGAPDFTSTPAEAGEGTAYVFTGSSAGLAAGSMAWPVELNVAGAHLGAAVTGAGDVNGDGYSDILLGAPGDTTDGKRGRALLYLGAPQLSTTSAWSRGGDGTAQGNFGVAVSGGDMNGDRFTDLLVGDGANASVYDFTGNPDASGPPIFCIPKFFPLVHQVAANSRFISIATRASAAPLNSFRLRVDAFNAAGRGDVQLEYETKPLGSAFKNDETVKTAWFDTGAPNTEGQSVYPFDITLSPAITGPVKWRARINSKDPYFPGNSWLTIPESGPLETDLCLLP